MPKLQSWINIRNIDKAEIGGKEEVSGLLGDIPVAILDAVHKSAGNNKRLQVLRILTSTARDKFQFFLLYSWFRASWLYINKIQHDATVCGRLFTAKLLYMFRVSIALIIRST